MNSPTSGCLGGELWVEVERVVGSSGGRFEGGVDLSADEFLRGGGNVRTRHAAS